MNPRVVNVEPNDDFSLTIEFDNGELRIFNVQPYLDKGFFRDLRERSVFYSCARYWAAFNGKGDKISALIPSTWTVSPWLRKAINFIRGAFATGTVET